PITLDTSIENSSSTNVSDDGKSAQAHSPRRILAMRVLSDEDQVLLTSGIARRSGNEQADIAHLATQLRELQRVAGRKRPLQHVVDLKAGRGDKAAIGGEVGVRPDARCIHDPHRLDHEIAISWNKISDGAGWNYNDNEEHDRQPRAHAAVHVSLPL